jgi:predicted membrane protein
MEKYIENNCENKRMKKVTFGIIVVIIGALLMASNFGYLPYQWRHIFFSWEMLLIAIGVVNLVSRESKTTGLILIAIGSFFLLPDLFDFSFSFIRLFWPVLLIVVGLSLILSKGSSLKWHRRHKKGTIDTGVIDEFNVFSGSKRRFANQVFKGGEVSNVFGGAELDLTQAILNEGENVLNIHCVFGGIALIVPADWNVRIEVVSIFGGFSDERKIIRQSTDDSKVLVIKGNCIFGGGDIKSY